MHENPEDFLDEEKEKDRRRRKWCINKALEMAGKNKTKEEPADIDKDDILETAKQFNKWVKGDEEA